MGCRLGFIVDFLSHAAIVGFMGGAATVVCLQQLKSILGLEHFTHAADIVSVMRSVFTQTHQVQKLKTKLTILIPITNLFKPILYKQTYFIFIVTIMPCNLSDLVFYSNKKFVSLFYLFGYCSGGGKALCWDFASFSFSLLQDTS